MIAIRDYFPLVLLLMAPGTDLHVKVCASLDVPGLSITPGSPPESGHSLHPTTQNSRPRLPLATTSPPLNIPDHQPHYRNPPPPHKAHSQSHYFEDSGGLDAHQSSPESALPLQFASSQPVAARKTDSPFASATPATKPESNRGASRANKLTTLAAHMLASGPRFNIPSPATTAGLRFSDAPTALPSTEVVNGAVKPDSYWLAVDTEAASKDTEAASKDTKAASEDTSATIDDLIEETTTTTITTTTIITTMQSAVPCQFNLSGSEGYIEAPPQPSSALYATLDCTYIITVYMGYGVEIQVMNVNLSEGDRVTLEDLGNGQNTVLANESILMRGLVVRSHSNQITIHLSSRSLQAGSVLLRYQAFVLSCTFPRRPAFGDVSVSSLHSGGEAYFFCLTGYQLQGSSTLICRNASTPYWTGEGPQCLAACGGLIKNITIGRLVSPGFPSNYSNNLTCHWLLEAPERHRLHVHFEKVTLAEDDDRLLIKNGNNIDAVVLYDSYEVEYLPNEGLVSSSRYLFIELTTDAMGTSTGVALRYQAFTAGHCYEPYVKYGNLTSSDGMWALGAVVEFSCDAGYTLEQGSVTIECIDPNNPQWNETEPACRAVCSGEITDAAGVVLSPNWPEAYDKGQDCIWGIHVEEDKRIMLDIQVLNLGKNDLLTFYDGDDLTAKILGQYGGTRTRFKLYTATADVTIQFQSDPATNIYGFGNGFVVHFFEVARNDTCPELPEISNGWKSTSHPELVHGTVVTYQCYPGYQVVGSELLMCQWDLTWSGDLPGCERVVSCSDPGKVEHSQRVLTSPQLTVGSTIQYVCTKGFMLSGNSLLTCYDHGSGPKWNQRLPRCLPETFEPCRHPGTPTYGIPNSNRLHFQAGETLRYTCVSGHKLLGEPLLRCGPGHPSQWSGLPPVCRSQTMGYDERRLDVSTGDFRMEGARIALAVFIPVTLLLVIIFGIYIYLSNSSKRVSHSAQGKHLRLPASSSLPYDHIAEESTLDSSVYETTNNEDTREYEVSI